MKVSKVIISIMFLALSLSNPVQAEDKKESSTTSDETLVLQGGKKPTPGIQVYDANGNHLGLATETTTNPITFYHPKTESFVGIDVRDGEVANILRLYFESDDCSGQAYIGANEMYSTYQNCDTYYTGQRVAPSYTTMSSVKDFDPCTCSAQGAWVGSPYYWVPAVEISAQTLGFTIPVVLPLSFKAKIEPLDK